MTLHAENISSKANRVLSLIALAFFLILIRVWYLSVVQHDARVEQAHKPQRKVVIESVERASIYDRFDIPLAINKMQYNASICYAHIRQIPAVRWEKNEEGKRVRTQPRLRHIEKMSQLLAQELSMHPQDIEDVIYGKASLLPHTPFVIKEDISEAQYYRLKMMEKDFLGLQTQRVAKRFYPQGKIGCDVLGYLGTISREKYDRIAEEMQTLEAYLKKREQNENPFLPPGFSSPVEVRDRLLALQEKSYSLNDLVGQAGVEKFYEEELRGLHGKKIYEIDTKGNLLRELPGSKEPLAGRKLNLTISAELQAFAEQLLSAHETSSDPNVNGLHEKWMRGGAIVAMDPNTGEVLALASYPRFDPNDFISTSREIPIKKQKEQAIQRWLESEAYIGQIWDGKRGLEKETFSFSTGKYQEEKIWLSWPLFLSTILPEKGALCASMEKITDLKTAVEVQVYGISHPYILSINQPEDRMLALDLCSLAAPQELFSANLIQSIGHHTLASHFLHKQTALRLLSLIKTHIQELYHDYDFAEWRKLHFKAYLKRKRKQEKEEKKYAKPYTDYLDAAEKRMFQVFWQNYSALFLYTVLSGTSPISLEENPQIYPYFAYLKGISLSVSDQEKMVGPLKVTLSQLSIETGLAYLKTFRSFQQLTKPLRITYPTLRPSKEGLIEKHLASGFYPPFGYSYGRSHAYRQIHAQGSVFKIVTAYQTLMERYELYKNGKTSSLLPPLTLIDDLKGDPRSTSLSQVLGYTENGNPILRYYKGGVLPRSSHSGIGKINLMGAIEQSSNIYFSLLAADFLQDPLNLSRAAESFGFGKKTGIDLPFEAQGHVPFDLNNRTKIYSFAIGHHTLAVTPLQTAVMLSAIANKGKILKPRVVKTLTGKQCVEKDSLLEERTFPFQESLALLGIDFPLFTLAQEDRQKNFQYTPPPETVRTMAFPPAVLSVLQKGMEQTILGIRGSSRPSIMRNTYHHPTALKDYYEMHHDMITKTGTAQFFYKHSLDKATRAEIKRHVWFGAISYAKKFESPELVIVVYSKFRAAGREVGPMAAQLIKRWREIQSNQ